MEEGITPYNLSALRRVPIPYYEILRTELTRMEEMEFIKKVDEPTEWCHPIVVVPKSKSDSIRICLDLTKLNNSACREIYQLPSVEETIAKIGVEGKWYAKLDANHGYWQMPLEEESQRYCTFVTTFRRYCPARGPFGLTFKYLEIMV